MSKRVGCNVMQNHFRFCEIIYLPLLVNIAYPASCNFKTDREDVELLLCRGYDREKYDENDYADLSKNFKLNLAYWMMNTMLVVAFIWALTYNFRLFKYVKSDEWRTLVQNHRTKKLMTSRMKQQNLMEMVREEVDEYDNYQRHIMKKELEYVLKINDTWAFERMYTFTSFKGGHGRSYGRVIFNIFAALLVFVQTIQLK